MSKLYVLADSALGDAAALMAQLRAIVAERYAVESVPGAEQLEQALAQAQRAVVVLASDNLIALNARIQQLRAVCPATACIALLDASAHSEPSALLTADCHVVRQPWTDFSLAGAVSAALHQVDLLAMLSGSAQLDEVTNLLNRSYFIKRLGEEIALSRRHLTPLCCVAVGIGGYQLYLDSYGYQFINGLLRFVGDKISTLTRQEDLVARIGDDEIGILLPRSTEKGAKVFTNRLVLTLNSLRYKQDGYEEELSASAGVAGYPLADGSEADADTVMRYARHALHQARCSSDAHVGVQLFSEIKPAL